MTKTEQDKILEDRIKSNTANFTLNRQTAIVSAFASGDFDKYEYLTRIDLALKPNSLQKARFEHSPLGNLLNKKLGDGQKDNKIAKIIEQRNQYEQSISEENESSDDLIERLATLRDDITDKKDAINQTAEELSRHVQTENIDNTTISTSSEDKVETKDQEMQKNYEDNIFHLVRQRIQQIDSRHRLQRFLDRHRIPITVPKEKHFEDENFNELVNLLNAYGQNTDHIVESPSPTTKSMQKFDKVRDLWIKFLDKMQELEEINHKKELEDMNKVHEK